MCMCSQTQAYIGTSSPAHGGEAPEPKSASRIKFLIQVVFAELRTSRSGLSCIDTGHATSVGVTFWAT